MTQAEQALLIAYLRIACASPNWSTPGSWIPRAIWRSSSWTGASSAGKRSPERHITRASPGRHKVVLDAARIKARSGVSRMDAGLAWPRARRSWAGTGWRAALGFHRFKDHVHRGED